MERSRHGALPVAGTVTPWRETWNSRPTPTNPRTLGAPGTAAGVERNKHGERSPYAASINRGGRRGEKQARWKIPVCGSHKPRRETWREAGTARDPRMRQSYTAAGDVEKKQDTALSPYPSQRHRNGRRGTPSRHRQIPVYRRTGSQSRHRTPECRLLGVGTKESCACRREASLLFTGIYSTLPPEASCPFLLPLVI